MKRGKHTLSAIPVNTYPPGTLLTKGDGVTDVTARLQADIDNAIASGQRRLTLLPGTYILTSELTISTPGVILQGAGTKSGATILQQNTWGRGWVQVSADGVKISDIYFSNTQTKTVINGTYQGEPARDRAAGIYCYDANELTVRDCLFDNMYCGVRFRGVTSDNAAKNYSSEVSNCRFYRCDMGILCQQQEYFTFSDLIGRNTEISQGTDPDGQATVPPHLIYLTGSSTKRNQYGAIANCVTYNNPYSSGFKFKFTNGLVASNLATYDCERGIDWEDCDGSSLSNITIDILTARASDSFQGGIIGLDLDNVTLSSCTIKVANGINEVPGIFLRSTDGTQGRNILVSDCNVIMGPTSTAKSGYQIQGVTNCMVQNCSYRDTGSSNSEYPFKYKNCTTCGLADPTVIGTDRIVYIDTDASSTKVHLNVNKLLGGVYQNSVNDNGTSTVVTFIGAGTRSLSPANSTTPNVHLCNVFTTNAPGGPLTITDFLKGWNGQQITLLGADNNTTVADSATIQVNGSWTSINDGNSLTLVNRSGVWYEVSRF